jgi:ribosome-associated heat shock protein Hsp15
MPTKATIRASEDTGPGASRIDRWLYGVRLFKSRSAAAEAVSGGKVHVNGERVRRSHAVKAGDTLTFMRGGASFECLLAAIPLRRGPASEAARCYAETSASKARRDAFEMRMKMTGGPTTRAVERPDKHARRLLRRLRGRDV